MKKASILIAAFGFILFSCKKEDKCSTTTETIIGNYKVTSARYKQTPGSSEVDFLALLDACEKDDLHKLQSGGVYIYEDAGIVCSPSGTYSDTWSLSGSTMIFSGEAAVIQSFDCTTLVLVLSNFNVSGDALTITLVKQ